ncbi:protease [Methylophaga lonarensis MPL]|uniref:Protease n=1 Tax=Methylophaga lonarensis MPL TaxID=1286106 RepID=M7PGY8_9GAMM|nr:tRNA 5-hydroxyuridine modification protein YegQ [Methylophaga lonarensis]EMR13165.1 protease [Methylophaga lonarensis MPL]
MKAPELLLPAGSLQHMRYAFAFGADAVYAGQPRYSLRVRNNDFHKLAIMEQGIREAHAAGKQFFVASNLMPHNAKIKTYMADMEHVIAMQPDALIMADPGLIMMVRERWPEMPIHLSVQANTVNYQAVRFWQSLGLTRVILSRELSLDEIEEIRQQCPDIELEVFVHGALCIAYSGRCLLSGYFNHRDPNQGTCTNACRWDYKTHASDQQDDAPQKIDFDALSAMQSQSFSDCGQQQRHPLADKIYLIEEANRPGELMPIFEDEHGTYIMNSKDLRAVQHIERLTRMGVDCLKIEGRTKSIYYVARTAQIYRKAIDDALAGRSFDPTLISQLDNLANRGYTDGFYQRHPTQEQQNYLHGYSSQLRQQFVGEVVAYDADNQRLEIDVRNQFSVGDSLEMICPEGNISFSATQLFDQQGQAIERAAGSGHRVSLPWQQPWQGPGLLAKSLNAGT